MYTRDLKEVTNEFNQFFTSVGAKASEDSQALVDSHNLPPLLSRTPQLYFFEADKFRFHAVSSKDVQRVVMSFLSDKAPGYDKIPISVIKDALPRILPILTLIVNRSLSFVFPAAWKLSEVVPLPKDGDHELANNNRPVSLLPAASKVCEWIALNQLTSYMNKNNRLTEHQSGNKAMHSCETHNVFMTDKA